MLKWLNKIDLLLLISVMAILLFVVVMLYGFNSGKFDFIKKDNKNRSAVQTKKKRK